MLIENFLAVEKRGEGFDALVLTVNRVVVFRIVAEIRGALQNLFVYEREFEFGEIGVSNSGVTIGILKSDV